MKKTVFILAVGLMLVQANAGAQTRKNLTNMEDTVFSIGEVSVTANRRVMNVTRIDALPKDLPISTNNISAVTLENRGITDIQKAANFLPGVRVNTSYGAFQQISIRGFDHSVIMVDGVRDERSSIDNSYPVMDLTSAQSIELLKGPASVLYGQSAVGGVINIVRRTPTAENHMNVRMSYGSWHNMQTTVGMGGKLVGPLNYLAHFNYQHTDGWRDNERRRLSGYFAIGGQLGEKDNILVRWSGNDDYYSTEIGLPDVMSYDVYDAATGQLYLKTNESLPGLDKKARYNSESDFMYNRGWSLTAEWNHRFNDAMKLSERASYTYDDIDYFGTESLDYLTSSDAIYNHYYERNGKRTYICLDSIYYSYPLRFSHVAKTFNNQIELSGKVSTGSIKHTYLAGYSLIYMRRVSYSGYNFVLDSSVTEDDGYDVWGSALGAHGSSYQGVSLGWMKTRFSKATPQDRWMHGFYAQDLIELLPQLKVMLAGRYDLYNYKRISNLPTIDGKRKFEDVDKSTYTRMATSAFTFRGGAVCEPTKSLSLYASFDTYFKPIYTFYNANYIYIDRNGNEFTPSNDGGEVFKPQKGYQWEGGLKYELGNKLSVNSSVFYIKKYNMNVNLGTTEGADGSQKTIMGQVGQMRSKGFDIDVTYTPVYDLSLTAGYGYTDAKYVHLAKNKYMTEYSSEGKQFTNVPKNNFYAYADYRASRGFLRGFGVNLSVTYMDKVYRNAANTLWYKAYWMTDLGLSYTLRNGVRLGVNVNNLFDKDYCNQSLGNQLVPGEPRNWQASVSYNF